MSNNPVRPHTLFEPDGECVASMVVVHGMSEHRHRYAEFAKQLNRSGVAVLTFDLRGHGESVDDEQEFGFFGHENGWLCMLEDIDEMAKWMGNKYPDVPLVIFGHSMGSMLVRSYIKRYGTGYDGVILCGAPNYNKAAKAGSLLARVMCRIQGNKAQNPLLRRMVDGSAAGAMKNDPDKAAWLSRNEQNRRNYEADPLCGFGFTNRGYADMLFGNYDMHGIKGWQANVNKPVLITVGSDDPCTGGEKGVADTTNTLHMAGYRDVEVKRYEGYRHEILNEDEKEIVGRDIIAWLNNKLI